VLGENVADIVQTYTVNQSNHKHRLLGRGLQGRKAFLLVARVLPRALISLALQNVYFCLRENPRRLHCCSIQSRRSLIALASSIAIPNFLYRASRSLERWRLARYLRALLTWGVPSDRGWMVSAGCQLLTATERLGRPEGQEKLLTQGHSKLQEL